MRNDFIRASMKKTPFMLYAPAMDSLLEMANSDTPRAESGTPKVANNSVVYQEIGSVAIISVDGGMYKKDIGGMCSSVASYDQMIKFQDEAEANSGIKTILYRVDTPGGAVAGADEVEDRIFKSKKRTITLYENLGASGGIWVFSASDELYATQTTMLGSIGVVVSYMEKDEETGTKRVEIVSKNAENKRCSLNGTCKEEIQTMIDTYEDMFFARVEKNTGFNAEKIKSTFNNGGMIFAEKAKEAGFIKEVITFDDLLKSLNSNSGSTFVPTASASENLISDDTTEKIEGADMKFDRDNLDATEDAFNVLVANRDTLSNRNDSLKVELQTATTALEAKNDEVAKLKASYEEKLSEAVGNTTTLKAEMQTRVEEAIEVGCSAETVLEMIKADSKEESSKIALEAQASGGNTHKSSSQDDKKSGYMAYATQNKGSIK